MKIALVELHVDLTGISPENGISSAVRDGIRHDADRVVRVRAALDATEDADLVVFPGWTVVAAKPPSWLVSASKGRTIVFECLLPGETGKVAKGGGEGAAGDGGYPWDTYVARDGKIVCGPVRQIAAEANELRQGKRNDLLDEIRSGERAFAFAGRKAMLLVCGEANIVDGGGGGRRGRAPPDVELSQFRVPLVVNPAHTPGGPQAIRDKRCWLSEKGVAVTTANTYSGLPKPKRAAWTGARAWRRGQVMPRHPKPVQEAAGVKVAFVTGG